MSDLELPLKPVISQSAGGMRAAARTPAVVIGADVNGLGSIRSLGQAGVPVFVLDDDRWHPGMHSRYAHPVIARGMSGPALVESLLTLRARLGHRPMLFMTSDDQVRTISEYRSRLAGAFHLGLPDHSSVCELLHKWSFHRLAESHGFPVPRTIAIRDESDIAALAEIRFPAVVKPGTKDLISSKRSVPRACRVTSREEAEALCRKILPTAPDLIVQEWIEGADSDIYFCLQYRAKNGVTVRSFSGRKLRSWPPQTGSTASCVAAPEVEAILEPLTSRFFDAVGCVGMCSMEFKRDRQNDTFLMVEPTIGRTDWQEEVATLHGVNIPLAAYCSELELPLPVADKAGDPVIWLDTPSHWCSVLVSRSFRDQRPPGATVKSACCRHDDPVPLAFFWLEWIQKIRRRIRWPSWLSRATTDSANGAIWAILDTPGWSVCDIGDGLMLFGC
jgi:D-aspartate ligase